MKQISVILWIFTVQNCLALNLHSKPLSGESVFQIESSWNDQDGNKFSLSALRGKISVVAMAYTSCQGACPIIISDMQKIEKDLKPSLLSQTHFILISFDSERDTPTQLKKFAKAHHLDPRHWTLLTGTPKSVRELAATLSIKYKKDADGDFSHSNVITVLDSEGIILHQQLGLRQNAQNSVESISDASKQIR